MDAQTLQSATPCVWSAPIHSVSTDPPNFKLVPGQRDKGVCAPNILICGEIGAGKSSIINLIAGQKLGPTSNSPFGPGCTLENKRHTVLLDGTSYNLWDTVGLGEGTGKKTASATSNLRSLLKELANAGGIHLLVYCIRADRLRSALQRNYDLLYGTICQKKVPVALVVTGLEHQRGGMETWWNENEEVLSQSGMWFDAHACVTTLDVEARIVQERRSESQRRLRELVVTYSRLPPWKTDHSFISHILPALRAALRRASSTGEPENTSTVWKMVQDDVAKDPDEFSPRITAVPYQSSVACPKRLRTVLNFFSFILRSSINYCFSS